MSTFRVQNNKTDTTSGQDLTPSKPNLPLSLPKIDFAQAFEKLKTLLQIGDRVQAPIDPDLPQPQGGTATPSSSSNKTPDAVTSLPIPTSIDQVQYLTMVQAWDLISNNHKLWIHNSLLNVEATPKDSPIITSEYAFLTHTPTPQNQADLQAFVEGTLPLQKVERTSLQFQAWYAVSELEILHIVPKDGPAFEVYRYKTRPLSDGDVAFNNYGSTQRTHNLENLFHQNELGLTSIRFESITSDTNRSMSVTPYSTEWASNTPSQNQLYYPQKNEDGQNYSEVADPLTWQNPLAQYDHALKTQTVAEPAVVISEQPRTAKAAKFVFSSLEGKIAQNSQATHEQIGYALTLMSLAANLEFWPQVKLSRFFNEREPSFKLNPQDNVWTKYQRDYQVSGNTRILTYTPQDTTNPVFQIAITIGKNNEELSIIIKTFANDGKTLLSEYGFRSSPSTAPTVSGLIYQIVYPADASAPQFFAVIQSGDTNDEKLVLWDGVNTFSPTQEAHQFTAADRKTILKLFPRNHSVIKHLEFPVVSNQEATASTDPKGSTTQQATEPRAAKAKSSDEPARADTSTPEPAAELEAGWQHSFGLRANAAFTAVRLTADFENYPMDARETGIGGGAQGLWRSSHFFVPNVGITFEGALGYHFQQAIFSQHDLVVDANVMASARAGRWQFDAGVGLAPHFALSQKGSITTTQGHVIEQPEYLSPWSVPAQIATAVSWRQFYLAYEHEFSTSQVAEDAEHITGFTQGNDEVHVGVRYEF